MMLNYGIYDITTGALVQIGKCLLFSFAGQLPSDPTKGLVRLPTYSWDYWVDTSGATPAVVQKTNMPYTINKTTMVADGVDQISITGLPNPVTVTWPDGIETVETDGSVAFALTLAGEYMVKLEAVPYLTEVINVTATN